MREHGLPGRHRFPGGHGEFSDHEDEYIAAFLANALTQED
jgi:hypothetical protein